MAVAVALPTTRPEVVPFPVVAPTDGGAPSPLVSTILGRQLEYMEALADLVKAGTPRAELDRLGAEVNAAILGDLVEPNGEAGWAAAEDAADRLLWFVHRLADEFGVDLDAGTA